MYKVEYNHEDLLLEVVLMILLLSRAANPKRARLFHDKSLESEEVYETFLRQDMIMAHSTLSEFSSFACSSCCTTGI